MDYGISAMNGIAAMDRQTFGAQVVTKTLDYMNNHSGNSYDSMPMDKQSFGAAVVSKTLDYGNSGAYGSHSGSAGMEQSYDFQKSVLGAAYSGVGAIANLKI